MYYLNDLNTIPDTSSAAVFRLPEHLMSNYAKEFCVPAQLASFAEGLWHLDHGYVEVCVLCMCTCYKKSLLLPK